MSKPVRHIGRGNCSRTPNSIGGCDSLAHGERRARGHFSVGCIDSSSLVALLSRKHPNLSTFSVVFKELDYSEAQYSRSISTRFGTDHHEIVISSHAVMTSLPKIIGAMDQPTVDGVNTYIISRETRRMGYKVALSGLGADEIFGGYDTFTTVPRMERFAWCAGIINPKLRRLLASIIRGAISKRRPGAEKLAVLIEGDGSIPHPYALAGSCLCLANCGRWVWRVTSWMLALRMHRSPT